MKNTTISEIKCTIENFSKGKNSIKENTFLWDRENSMSLFFHYNIIWHKKAVLELHQFHIQFPEHVKSKRSS